MYAVIKSGGKQYKVKSGDFIEIEKLEKNSGDKVVFEEVLAIGEEGGAADFGAPLLVGAKVEGEVVENFRGKKLIVFKMKRRKSYRRTRGHRQELTKVRIDLISK